MCLSFPENPFELCASDHCLKHPASFPFVDHCLRTLHVVDVDRVDLKIRLESVPVEQDCPPSEVGHMEAACDALVLQIFTAFLQSNDVPLRRHMLLNCPQVSRALVLVPVKNTDSSLFLESVRQVVKSVSLSERIVFFSRVQVGVSVQPSLSSPCGGFV